MASHLTLQEREIVAQMHHDHWKQREIAERLKRDPSTISRELSRNRSRNGYWASKAQAMADDLRIESHIAVNGIGRKPDPSSVEWKKPSD